MPLPVPLVRLRENQLPPVEAVQLELQPTVKYLECAAGVSSSHATFPLAPLIARVVDDEGGFGFAGCVIVIVCDNLPLCTAITPVLAL